MRMTGTALTDNRGNSYVVSRMITTKFPLCAVLMELTEQLDLRGSWLQVSWTPRDQNAEADALTNGHFHQFDPALRINMKPEDMSWVLLDEMLKAGGAMTEELLALKAQKRALRVRSKELKKQLKKKRLPGDTLKVRDPWSHIGSGRFQADQHEVLRKP